MDYMYAFKILPWLVMCIDVVNMMFIWTCCFPWGHQHFSRCAHGVASISHGPRKKETPHRVEAEVVFNPSIEKKARYPNGDEKKDRPQLASGQSHKYV